jgi:hypothetical protein
MDREGAETYLRLLAEAAMRGSLSRAAEPGAPGTSRMMVVGHALTAVGALDPVIAEEILTDFRLAVSVRQLRGEPGQVAGQAVTAAQWLGQGRAVLHRKPPPAPPGSALPGSAPPGDDAGQERADRFVPIGLTVPFHAGAISGELCLMSFAQTGAGARFVAAWGVRTPSLEPQLGFQHPGLIPFEEFTVTDDRGGRYQLDHSRGSDMEWPNLISLSPAPPEDIRWLDVAPPYRQAVRVDLRPPGGAGRAGEAWGARGVWGGGQPPHEQGGSGGDRPPGTERASQVSVGDTTLSPGEHLLIMLAERLLTWTPGFPRGGPSTGLSIGPWRAMAAGFGDIIAALEAADVLSPTSPVPARLATLCASLDLNGHGIAVPPAHDLPEPWLSLLAHYQRRKPDPAQMRDAYAAMAASLPELDGIRLALLGLQHTQGSSALHVLARGHAPEPRPGPLDIDLSFPLSLWLRDSGGRWHAARQDRCHRADLESTIRLRLVPPLTRPADWVEVLARGRSAEVRARLPLHWRYPS